MKICNSCGRERIVEDYGKLRSLPDGIMRDCVDCARRKRSKFRESESAQRMRRYYADHEANLSAQRQYQKANRETYRAACSRWREKNPEKQRAAQKRWDATHPEVNAAAAMRYYTGKRQRCPLWLTPEQHAEMGAFYVEARKRTVETGVKHVVDHIVPLHGKDVSGLHVPWNLRVLTAAENIRKHNRLDLVTAAGGDACFTTGPGTL